MEQLDNDPSPVEIQLARRSPRLLKGPITPAEFALPRLHEIILQIWPREQYIRVYSSISMKSVSKGNAAKVRRGNEREGGRWTVVRFLLKAVDVPRDNIREKYVSVSRGGNVCSRNGGEHFYSPQSDARGNARLRCS